MVDLALKASWIYYWIRKEKEKQRKEEEKRIKKVERKIKKMTRKKKKEKTDRYSEEEKKKVRARAHYKKR